MLDLRNDVCELFAVSDLTTLEEQMITGRRSKRTQACGLGSAPVYDSAGRCLQDMKGEYGSSGYVVAR